MHIKYKALELSFEGDQSFVSDGLVSLCKDILALNVPESEAAPVGGEQTAATPISRKSTADFAVALGVHTGPDLVMAACAFLHFTEGREELKRADILEAMKSAKSYYKPTYASNLSSYLNGLAKKNRLGNPGNEVYALKQAEIDSMRTTAVG